MGFTYNSETKIIHAQKEYSRVPSRTSARSQEDKNRQIHNANDEETRVRMPSLGTAREALTLFGFLKLRLVFCRLGLGSFQGFLGLGHGRLGGVSSRLCLIRPTGRTLFAVGTDLRERGLVHGELNCVGFRARAQVVHAGFEARAPRVEVHRSELSRGRLRHVNVQALRLANERAPVRRHVQAHLLLDFPHGFVQVLEILRHLGNALHAALVRNHLRAHVLGPDAPFDQVPEQELVHHHELAGQRAAVVHVRRERLNRLVIAQDLGGGRGGHGRHEERVPEAVLRHFRLEARPVPPG